MKMEKAWKLDTEVYVEMDENMSFWCVFGDNSGFAYFNSVDEEKAKQYADELNKNKKSDLTYQ